MIDMFNFLFLFAIGSILGWCLEVLFRKQFSSTNPEHKWINPGFCCGPYLPLYGFGLCILYLLSSVEFNLTPIWDSLLTVMLIAVCMTVIEYVAGIFFLKFYKIRLWDYSKMPGNIQGIICPLFSFFWALLGAAYFFLMHPFFTTAVAWLEKRYFMLFFLGLFYGVFIIDLIHSSQLVSRLKQLAVKNKVILRYEKIKVNIQTYHKNLKKRYAFFRPFRSDLSLSEHLEDIPQELRQRLRKRKESKKQNSN